MIESLLRLDQVVGKHDSATPKPPKGWEELCRVAHPTMSELAVELYGVPVAIRNIRNWVDESAWLALLPFSLTSIARLSKNCCEW